MKKWIIAVIAALGLTGAAFAQQAPSGDLDHNGCIDKVEVLIAVEQAYPHTKYYNDDETITFYDTEKPDFLVAHFTYDGCFAGFEFIPAINS